MASNNNNNSTFNNNTAPPSPIDPSHDGNTPPPPAQATAPALPHTLRHPTHAELDNEVEEIMENIIADKSKKRYLLENINFVLWLYNTEGDPSGQVLHDNLLKN